MSETKITIIGMIIWGLIFWALLQLSDEIQRQPTDERYDYDTKEVY